MIADNRIVAVLLMTLLAGVAVAAEPPAPGTAPKSSAASSPPGNSSSRPASADAMPAVSSPAATVNKPSSSPADKGTTTAAQPARRTGSDRLDLDTTVVTGNRELPKVLYIVPWKRSDLGDLPPQPLNTLLDEVLTPVDRDVFRREVTYYGAMAGPDDPARGTPATSGAASEK